MKSELIVDNFAGGGGASLGIEWGLEGRHVDIAVNHDAGAVEMHSVNHPHTRHYREDVWKVDPVKVCGGRPVGLAWFSPDCRHFSRAKGSKPVSPRVRGLAWLVVHWIRKVRPRVIMLENVREFEDWGPVIPKRDEQGNIVRGPRGDVELVPDPARKGMFFKRYITTIRNLGYQVEWRHMDAADYGAPTHRKRLFLIARCDGEAIVWPAATHAPRAKARALGLKAHEPVANCIDWDLPCPSIFNRPEQGKPELRDTSMKRIAHGLMRFVINCKEPFIVRPGHYSNITGEGSHFRGQSIHEPISTITQNNDKALIMPYVARMGQTGGNGAYVNDARDPIGSIVSKNEHMLAMPFLMYGRSKSAGVSNPSGTIVQKNHSALVAAWVVKHFGGGIGADAVRPMPTLTARGTQNQLAAAYLVHFNHGEKQWSDMRDPARTLTTNCHARAVYAFLLKYYGADGKPNQGQSLHDPLGSVTTRDRFGLVVIWLWGEPYVIVDIGMRMLTPRELARAQGFPDSYILTGNKTNQIKRLGNSVCPVMPQALVSANVFAPRVEVRAG